MFSGGNDHTAFVPAETLSPTLDCGLVSCPAFPEINVACFAAERKDRGVLGTRHFPTPLFSRRMLFLLLLLF